MWLLGHSLWCLVCKLSIPNKATSKSSLPWFFLHYFWVNGSILRHYDTFPLWKLSSVHLASVKRQKGKPKCIRMLIIWRNYLIQAFLKHKKGGDWGLMGTTPKTDSIRGRRYQDNNNKEKEEENLVQFWYSKSVNRSEQISWRTVQWGKAGEDQRKKMGQNHKDVMQIRLMKTSGIEWVDLL